jgi:sodium/potassium-transporting ATPase subunit alpha
MNKTRLEPQDDNPEVEPLLEVEVEKIPDVIVTGPSRSPKVPYNEHLMTVTDLNKLLRSRINADNPNNSLGLSKEDAEDILRDVGPNSLTPPPSTPLWLLFLSQFSNLFMILLLSAALLCFGVYFWDPSDDSNLILGFFLLVVVIITCYETFAQEAKADELMEKFRALVPEDATVIRDGVQASCGVETLVVGDIVCIQAGQKIPADCRIFFCQNFKVDQSSITGESEAVECCVDAESDNPLESKNLIFNGSLAVEGSCMAVVIRTGDTTLIGNLVSLTSDVNKGSTNLKRDTEYFVLIITIFSLMQAIIVLIIGYAKGMPLLNIFIQGFIVIIVANIPQGLPTTVVTCLHIIGE